MTEQEKQALAKWLNEIAADLESADASTEADAKAYADRHDARIVPPTETTRYAYQTGALGEIARSRALSLRAAIRAYLEPKGRVA